MFQKLSYFNILFALVYVLIYLKDGTLNSLTGVFMVIVINWLALRSYELENYRWSVVHYLTGLWSLYYMGFIFYGLLNIFSSAIAYDFVSNDTIVFLCLSTILTVAVCGHLFWFAKKGIDNKIIN